MGAKAVKVTKDRLRIAERIHWLDDIEDFPKGIEGFKQALANVEKSDFLTGRDGAGFELDFDFLCQERSFARLIEGFYSRRFYRQKANGQANGFHAGGVV